MNNFEYFISTLPENQQDTVGYRMRQYWEYNGKPKDFQETLSKGMFVWNDEDQSYHAFSVAKNPETGYLDWMKPKGHPTRWIEYLYGWELNPITKKNYNLGHFDSDFHYMPKKKLGGMLNYFNFFK